jgi:glycosyltransferase involved in cell wall biosynthesis
MRAALVLLPSQREGFGLPVVEALACGTPVICSDLPVLREVGGEAARYCRVADIEGWAETIISLLRAKSEAQSAGTSEFDKRRELCLAQAARFSWSEYARRMVEIYQHVLRTAEISQVALKTGLRSEPRVLLPR